jgi:hypothetical protein
MKKCNKCGETKSLEEFYNKRRSKDSKRGECISCTKEYRNSDHQKQKDKEYRERNKDHIRKVSKEYKEKNCEKISEKNKKYSKQWRDSNAEYVKQNNRERYLLDRENRKEYRKKYEKDHPEWKKEYNKKYQKENKEKIREYNNNYVINRKKKDPMFKLIHNIRSLIFMCMKNGGFSKKTKTYKILGCSYDEFKIYLENKFTEGMSWVNLGEWHIDHIIPVSSAKTEEEMMILNHYTNLQPLWESENIKKGNKFNYVTNNNT